jgi:fatty acid-binding protein DegV
MDIKKLCEEFHEKIGKEKTIKITIEDNNVEKLTDNGFIGELKPEIVEEMKRKLENHIPTPYLKIRELDKVVHIYTGLNISTTK